MNKKERIRLEQFLKNAKRIKMFRWREFFITPNFGKVEEGPNKFYVHRQGNMADDMYLGEISEDAWENHLAEVFAAKQDLREFYTQS